MTFLLFFVLPVTLKPKYVAFALLGIELMGFLFYGIYTGRLASQAPWDAAIAPQRVQ